MIIKNHTTSEITSLKDASYQGCISAERGQVIGQYIYNVCPTFLESVPDDVKAQIEEGQMLRFHERHPAQYYTTDYVPCSADTKGALKVDTFVVMGYSQQEFGRMKSEDPVKHGVHAKWRKDWSTYKSNRMSDLKGYVKEYVDSLNGVTKTRASTKDFEVWLKETVDTIKTRAKTAKGRGDTTVNDSVVNAIVKAIK